MDEMASKKLTAQPGAQPPEETSPVQIKPISKVAGGIPAIAASVKHAWGEMGPVRGTRTLLRLNQKGEFDCPGCAWPEPDGERSHFEFCEEGAKHVADEATTSRVTPEFFQQWSLSDLSSQSDYWLNNQGRITQPMVLREGGAHYETINWEEVFALLACVLNALSLTC